MPANNFYLEYDEEGDILEAAWQDRRLKPGIGLELSFHVVLHLDENKDRPVRLMLLSYKRLIEQEQIELDNPANLPPAMRAHVEQLLCEPPLSMFLHVVRPGVVCIANPTMRAVAVATIAAA